MRTNKENLILEILTEVQKEFNETYNLDISMEQLRLVINLQDKLVSNAVFTGKGIKLPNLGKFAIPNYNKAKMTDAQVVEQHKLQSSSCLINRIQADYTIGY